MSILTGPIDPFAVVGAGIFDTCNLPLVTCNCRLSTGAAAAHDHVQWQEATALPSAIPRLSWYNLVIWDITKFTEARKLMYLLNTLRSINIDPLIGGRFFDSLTDFFRKQFSLFKVFEPSKVNVVFYSKELYDCV